MWKLFPQIPSNLALSTTHATVCTKFNISCWGHFLSHGLSQNPGVFVARKSEAALAGLAHRCSPCGPAVCLCCQHHCSQPSAVPINPAWVPTSPSCFRVGGTDFPTSEEILAPTAFCPWELLSFLAQTPLPSFQNAGFHPPIPCQG